MARNSGLRITDSIDLRVLRNSGVDIQHLFVDVQRNRPDLIFRTFRGLAFKAGSRSEQMAVDCLCTICVFCKRLVIQLVMVAGPERRILDHPQILPSHRIRSHHLGRAVLQLFHQGSVTPLAQATTQWREAPEKQVGKQLGSGAGSIVSFVTVCGPRAPWRLQGKAAAGARGATNLRT